MRNQDNCPICESVNLICLKEDNPIGYGTGSNSNEFEYNVNVIENPSVKKFVRRSFNLKIMQCKTCEHVFQYRVFTLEEEIEFYSTHYLEREPNDIIVCDPLMFTETVVQEIRYLNSIQKFRTILDIGAAFGEFCFLAKSLKLEPCAYDICTKSNNFLNNNAIEWYDDLTKINKKFDVVRISHILSHVHNNIKELISNSIGLLKPGGIIYFADHESNLPIDFEVLRGPLHHVHLFSKKSFNHLLSEFNDKIEIIQNAPKIIEEEGDFIYIWARKK